MSASTVDAGSTQQPPSVGNLFFPVSKKFSMRESFAVVLFLATVFPYGLALALLAFKPVHSNLQSVTNFIAYIHVPMTAYLLFDPLLRKRSREEPFKFIVMPILIFAFCIAIFLLSTAQIHAGNAKVLTYILVGVLCWNNWHFGKQNIGVYSYHKLATGSRRMLPVERKMIYLGAILGALSVSFLGLRLYQDPYAIHAQFPKWSLFAGHVGTIAQSIQYGLAVFTVGYLIVRRRQLTLPDVIMLFLCTNFWLPAYAGLKRNIFTFYEVSSLSHGLQYIAFLFFHSSNEAAKTSGEQPLRKYKNLSLLIVVGLLSSEIFMWKFGFGRLHFSDTGSEAYWMSFFNAIPFGVLLTHFWLDSFFWRFKNKEARGWMLERYNFLFKPSV